jgi:hypothetical protein
MRFGTDFSYYDLEDFEAPDPPPEQAHYPGPSSSDFVLKDSTTEEDDDDREDELNAPLQIIHPADLKIAYLHRTARDFLERPEIWSIIMKDSPEDFNAQETLMRSLIISLKSSRPTEPNANTNLITWSLQYAEIVELRFQTMSLHEMEHIMKAAVELCQGITEQPVDQIEDEVLSQISKHGDSGFLNIAARYNIQSFVQHKLQTGAVVFPDHPNRPLLDSVVGEYQLFPSFCQRSESKEGRAPDLSFIRRLLKSGHDPNSSFAGRTAWERVLIETRRIVRDETSPEQRRRLLLHWAQIIDEFIKHDADPYANKNGPCANAIREAFGSEMPKVARAFEDRLNKSQRVWVRLGKFLSFSNDTAKSGNDLVPLFRQIQLENAQMPIGSHWEYYNQSDTDPKPKKGGLLGALKRFEPSR